HEHEHEHEHQHEHGHEHEHKEANGLTLGTTYQEGTTNQKVNLTPWILFLVFVLGPCEPLIPVLMYPAAQASTAGLVTVTLVFALTTISTMVGVVLAVNYGVNFIKIKILEKYTHVIAGATIALSGVLILLGL
ncbi:MAG: sulfite exporter TauE/SafE family protein, partial [Prolixibacteraceae bacterium]|nr:sulfite exporter TauE/SafE family protein [Prolixibacteraceae bacterium]